MNDENDLLERELRAFAPRPPSPRLARGVAARLAGPPAAPRFLGLLALAASLALVVFLGRPGVQRPEPPRPSPPPVEAGEELPTLGAYRRALDESPEALDRLLDRHASAGASDEPSPLTVSLSHSRLFD